MAKKKAQPNAGSNGTEHNNKKLSSIAHEMESPEDAIMNTNNGVPINDDQNSLKAGDRGSTLLEDFILREKITHFDHERIPERVVHARGAAAHGVFKLYKPIGELSKAQLFNDTAVETPVF